MYGLVLLALPAIVLAHCYSLFQFCRLLNQSRRLLHQFDCRGSKLLGFEAKLFGGGLFCWHDATMVSQGELAQDYTG